VTIQTYWLSSIIHVPSTAVLDVQQFDRTRAFLCPHRCRASNWGFYALGIGLGLATRRRDHHTGQALTARFLCHCYGLGFATECFPQRRGVPRFYAIGIGLGWRHLCTHTLACAGGSLFLCPRYRAGLCDVALIGLACIIYTMVSMPSVSGWALRRTLRSGPLDLPLCAPSH
jgi:hypothetical protein